MDVVALNFNSACADLKVGATQTVAYGDLSNENPAPITAVALNFSSACADLKVGATLMASAAIATQRSTTTPGSFHGMTPKKPLQATGDYLAVIGGDFDSRKPKA